MIAFVKRLEEVLTLEGSDGRDSEAMSSERESARKILAHFKTTWQDAIEQVNKQVHSDYSGASQALAKEVLKATLTQLLLYYTRFVEILKQIRPDLLKDSVTVPSIMYEIKKFR